MNLILQRETFTENSTMGKIKIVDSDYWWYTLEDKDRGLYQDKPETWKNKIYGITCIPYGRFEVIIDYSNRFKRMMPHILNVPAFEGIRVHSGKKASQTLGCPLIGKLSGLDWIGNKDGEKTAFEEFYPILESSLKTERCFIDIVKAEFTRNVIA